MFITWFLIGSISYVLAMYVLLRKDSHLALSESDVLSMIGAMILAGIFGPLFTALAIYWFWDAWVSTLLVDEDDKREFPWRKP